MGCQTADDGFVTVNATGKTNVFGVWATGNVVDPRAQVITSAGAGSAAAIAINADLVDEDVARAVTQRDSCRAIRLGGVRSNAGLAR